MSDWDFLHEMHERGCSAEEIRDAAAVGYDPSDPAFLDAEWLEDEFEGLTPEAPASLRQPSDGEAFQSRSGFPHSMHEQLQIFLSLVEVAERHFTNTGRYLQVWGELGEIYAEIKFGLRRHATHQAGSDGTIEGHLVEVKTISPEKRDLSVMVKRGGDFEKLLIVRIDDRFQFTGKLLDREDLSNAGRRFLRARIDPRDADEQ